MNPSQRSCGASRATRPGKTDVLVFSTDMFSTDVTKQHTRSESEKRFRPSSSCGAIWTAGARRSPEPPRAAMRTASRLPDSTDLCGRLCDSASVLGPRRRAGRSGTLAPSSVFSSHRRTVQRGCSRRRCVCTTSTRLVLAFRTLPLRCAWYPVSMAGLGRTSS